MVKGRAKPAKPPLLPVAIVSSQQLGESKGASIFQYEDLIARSGSKVKLNPSKWDSWVLFDFSPRLVKDRIALEELLHRIRNSKTNIIVVGNPDGLVVKIMAGLVGETPQPIEPLLSYKLDAMDTNPAEDFKDFLVKVEKAIPEGRTPYKLDFRGFAHTRNKLGDGEGFSWSPLCRIARTRDEVVASHFVFERGGSMSLFPFWNIEASLETAAVLRNVAIRKYREWTPPSGRLFKWAKLLRPPDTSGTVEGEFSHDEAFTELTWKGRTYQATTPRRVALVRCLHKALVSRKGFVRTQELLDFINDQPNEDPDQVTVSLPGLLRNWDIFPELITRPRRGSYALAATYCSSCKRPSRRNPSL